MNADAHAVGERLAALYREIHRTAMSGAPICNDALLVDAVGFRDFEDHVVGVIVTPWFSNLVVAAQFPGGPPTLSVESSPLRLRFPAGDVDFNVSKLDGFGPLAACSLFSPMSEFADHEAAREAARAALDALFDPHLHEAWPEKSAARSGGIDRRVLFGGRRRQEPSAKVSP